MEVRLNFHADFRKIVEMVLVKNDVAVDTTESYNDAVYRYYANVRRRLNVQRYRVVEADQLVCPRNHVAGYAQLKAEFEQGADVAARLSRQVSKATYEDLLLNDWGIMHFHLGLRDTRGDVPRTGVVLFALVRDDVVHCIGFFGHGAWSSIEVLEIVQHNWPQLMEHARVNGVTIDVDHTDEERAMLRAAGATMFVTVNGVVYAPVGGGYTSARTSAVAHKQADRAILSVAAYEKHVRENVATIIKDFERAGRVVGTPPTFHFGFLEDGRAIATEPNAEASFILGPFPL